MQRFSITASLGFQGITRQQRQVLGLLTNHIQPHNMHVNCADVPRSWPACTTGASGKTAKAGAAAEPVEASKPDSEAEGLKEAASKRAGDVEFENQLAMAMQVRPAMAVPKRCFARGNCNVPAT